MSVQKLHRGRCFRLEQIWFMKEQECVCSTGGASQRVNRGRSSCNNGVRRFMSTEVLGMSRGSRDLHQYMMQLELVNARFNLIGCHVFPFACFGLFLVAILTCTGIIQLNEQLFPCIPLVVVYSAALKSVLCIVFLGFFWIRTAEEMGSESISTHSFSLHGFRGTSIWHCLAAPE